MADGSSCPTRKRWTSEPSSEYWQKLVFGSDELEGKLFKWIEFEGGLYYRIVPFYVVVVGGVEGHVGEDERSALRFVGLFPV